MTINKPATTRDEQIVYIDAGEETLFAVLTQPTVPANGTAVVALSGGAWMTSIGRGRIWVRLARQLAPLGYHTLRLDYRGVGDSTGRIDLFELERPATEDLLAAIRWLADQGIERFVLVGTCYGGRTALAAAESIEGLAGVVLSTTPVEDHSGSPRSLLYLVRKALSPSTLRKLRKRYRRYLRVAAAQVRIALSPTPQRRTDDGDEAGQAPLSSLYLDPLVRIVERRIPVMILFGTEDEYYGPYAAARDEIMQSLPAADRHLVDERMFNGELHGQVNVGAQDFIIDVTTEWLTAASPPRGIAPDPAIEAR